MALIPVPQPIPEWWLPLSLYRCGVIPERPRSPKPPKPAPAWCLQEWQRFDAWNAWKDGKVEARPADAWLKTPEWAWKLREAILKARKGVKPPPPPPPPPPPSETDVFLKPGLMMYSANNLPGSDAPVFCRKAKEAGFAWIGLLTHEGQNVTGSHFNPPGFREAIKDEGLAAVAWGSLFDMPEEEAKVAAQTAEPFDFYLPNPELAYKLETGEEAFFRSGRFMGEFRLHSQKRGAISTLVGADIHYRPWIDAGFDVLGPQAYTNSEEYGSYTPLYAIERAQGSVQHDFPGWQIGRVCPTIGMWGGDFYWPIEKYAPLLRQAGCERRWWVYSGEFMRDADFAAAKALILG